MEEKIKGEGSEKGGGENEGEEEKMRGRRRKEN
jgi:hypothetical protein